jgi:hypothetical protein
LITFSCDAHFAFALPGLIALSIGLDLELEGYANLMQIFLRAGCQKAAECIGIVSVAKRTDETDIRSDGREFA